MDIFGVITPQYRELEEKEKEVSKLRSIWEIRSEWEALYTSWKDTTFRDIEAHPTVRVAFSISDTRWSKWRQQL